MKAIFRRSPHDTRLRLPFPRPMRVPPPPPPVILDSWAIPLKIYPCSPNCHFLYQVGIDGAWYGNSNPEDYPDRWGHVGTWEELTELFADCSAHLLRAYGPAASQ